MTESRQIVFESKDQDHNIFIIPRYGMFEIDLENPRKETKSTPNCILCGTKTEKDQLYSVHYSAYNDIDQDDEPLDAIMLGFGCARHINEPDFQSRIIKFVSQQLAEIARKFALHPPDSFVPILYD